VSRTATISYLTTTSIMRSLLRATRRSLAAPYLRQLSIWKERLKSMNRTFAITTSLTILIYAVAAIILVPFTAAIATDCFTNVNSICTNVGGGNCSGNIACTNNGDAGSCQGIGGLVTYWSTRVNATPHNQCIAAAQATCYTVPLATVPEPDVVCYQVWYYSQLNCFGNLVCVTSHTVETGCTNNKADCTRVDPG
jgi:hypothetical protein